MAGISFVINVTKGRRAMVTSKLPTMLATISQGGLSRHKKVILWLL